MSKKSLARLIRIVTGTFGTARDEVFSLESNLTRFERFVHFWVLVSKSFVRNRCPIRASALSYTTLLALIPMLAVAMSITSIFLKNKGTDQIREFVERFVERVVPDNFSNAFSESLPGPIYGPELPPGLLETSPAAPGETNLSLVRTNEPVTVSDGNAIGDISATNALATLKTDARVQAVQKKVADYIHQFIKNTYSGTLGVTGVVILLWTAIVMLTRIEETFNDIWGVTRGRNWLSRIVLYWTTISLGPTLLVCALGLASGPYFQKTRALISAVPFLQPVISQLLPVAVISVTFALFYKLVPNTRVHFGAAFVGGALAGTSWHLFNLLSLQLASRAVNASKIYGSLALVPLLMVGLYTAWVIVLFGAQVAYAFQNRESYLQERIAENVNQRGREFVALRLMTCIGQHFHQGLPPATVQLMSRELGIPTKLVQQVLQTLLAARLVVEVHGAEPGYAPARPLDSINGHHILLAMRATQGQELITRDEPVRTEVYGEFARIQAAEKEAASSVTMLALIHRAQARLELAPPGEPERNLKSTVGPAPVSELPTEPVAPVRVAAETRTEPNRPGPPPSAMASAPPARPETEDEPSFPL